MNISFNEDEVFPHTEMEDTTVTNGHGVPLHWLHAQEASKYSSIVGKSNVPNSLALNAFCNSVRPDAVIPTDKVDIRSTVRHSSPAVLAANSSIFQSSFSKIRPMSSQSRLRLGLDGDFDESPLRPQSESLEMASSNHVKSTIVLKRSLSPGGKTKLQPGGTLFGGGSSILRPISAGAALMYVPTTPVPQRPMTAKLSEAQRLQVAGRVAELVEDTEFAKEFVQTHPELRDSDPLCLTTDTSSIVFQSTNISVDVPSQGVYNAKVGAAFSLANDGPDGSSLFSPAQGHRHCSGAAGFDTGGGPRRPSTAGGSLPNQSQNSSSSKVKLPLSASMKPVAVNSASKLLNRLIRTPPVPKVGEDGQPVYFGIDGSVSTAPSALPKVVANKVPAMLKRDISYKNRQPSSSDLLQDELQKTNDKFNERQRQRTEADGEAVRSRFVEKQRALGANRGTKEFTAVDHMTDSEILKSMPHLPGLNASDASVLANSSMFNTGGKACLGSASSDVDDLTGPSISFRMQKRVLTFDEDDYSDSGGEEGRGGNSPTRRGGGGGLARSDSGIDIDKKSMVDEKLLAARRRRQEAREAQEKKIQEGRAERERKIVLKQIMLLRSQMQTQWGRFAYIFKYASMMSEVLVEYRSHEWERAEALRRKESVTRIERWWMSVKYRVLLRQHRRSAARMRICVRVCWKVIKIRHRRKSAELVVQFIRDTGRLGTTTQAIYRYRAAVKLAQRWVRGFLVCQEARMQLLYMVIVREEKRKHRDALHAIRMAELQKKAKLRQIDGMKNCFGRALVDHKSSDAGTRRMANTQENRIEMRLIKKQEKLSNILEVRAEKEEEYAHSCVVSQKATVMRAQAKGTLSVNMPPFSQLSREQRLHLAKILATQRRFHLMTFDQLCKKVIAEQKYHVVEMADVRNFLKYAEPEPEVEQEKLPAHYHVGVKFKKNKGGIIGGVKKPEPAPKRTTHHWELNKEEVTMPK